MYWLSLFNLLSKMVFTIKILAQEQALIEGICSEISDVIAIYVFGSVVTGELRTDSDIDLAILPASPLAAAGVWKLAQSLAVVAGRDLDLVDLLSASTVMRAQVISTGVRLHCVNESLCSEFEGRVYSDYARLNEERKGILDDIAKRGRVYG